MRTKPTCTSHTPISKVPYGKEGYTRTNLTSVCNQIVNAGRSCDAQCSLAFTNFITKKGEIYEKPRRKPIEDS
jgi:hypothetical protein